MLTPQGQRVKTDARDALMIAQCLSYGGGYHAVYIPTEEDDSVKEYYTRLRSRYYRLIRHGKKKNVAVAAIARELACFIWGMMTGNIGMKTA